MTTNGIFIKPATTNAKATVEALLDSLVEQYADANQADRAVIEGVAITSLCAVLSIDATPAHAVWQFAIDESGL